MNINNPYKGLFPYTAKDENFFFGREKEGAELIDMIKNNQLVILYGESGTGKTSLINAKLFPGLRRQYYIPIYIRLNFVSNEEPLIQIRQTIYEELSKLDKNIPMFSDNMTLIEYAAKSSIFSGLVKPILFFDQFEELFTLGPKHCTQEQLDNLINQLSDLIEIRLPGLGNKLSKITEDNQSLSEEICTENVLKFTVVFSLRQDFTAYLDDLRYKIPSINNSRYRIRKLSSESALDAIIMPAIEFQNQSGLKDISIIDKHTALEVLEQLKRLEFTKDHIFKEINQSNLLFTIRKLFKIPVLRQNQQSQSGFGHEYLNEIEIDPTVLSLYCYLLYEESKISKEKPGCITLEKVSKAPCEEIISNYYKTCLSDKLKYWVEYLLITPDGRRLLIPLKKFAEESKVKATEIRSLKEKTAIIRIYNNNDEDIELAHDQIAKRALISKRSREANKIIRNAFAFLLVALILISLLSLSFFYYYTQKEKEVNIKDLNQKIISLEMQLQYANKNREELEANYSMSLSSKKAADELLNAKLMENRTLQANLENEKSRMRRMQNEQERVNYQLSNNKYEVQLIKHYKIVSDSLIRVTYNQKSMIDELKFKIISLDKNKNIAQPRNQKKSNSE